MYTPRKLESAKRSEFSTSKCPAINRLDFWNYIARSGIMSHQSLGVPSASYMPTSRGSPQIFWRLSHWCSRPSSHQHGACFCGGECSANCAAEWCCADLNPWEQGWWIHIRGRLFGIKHWLQSSCHCQWRVCARWDEYSTKEERLAKCYPLDEKHSPRNTFDVDSRETMC